MTTLDTTPKNQTNELTAQPKAAYTAEAKLRDALLRRKYSLNRFARESGISRATLTRIQNSDNTTLEMVARIANQISRLTGVPCHPDELVKWVAEPTDTQ